MEAEFALVRGTKVGVAELDVVVPGGIVEGGGGELFVEDETEALVVEDGDGGIADEGDEGGGEEADDDGGEGDEVGGVGAWLGAIEPGLVFWLEGLGECSGGKGGL